MSSKRKTDPAQPDLPIDSAGAVPAKPAANGQGESHVLAEEVPAVPHTPFAPDKIVQPLHRRVNTSFLEYASYVIRDRAIPNLADGL